MLRRRSQIAILAGSEGSYATTVQDALYAKVPPENLTIAYDVTGHERAPQRSSIGAVQNVAGRRFAKFSFRTEMKGSGIAGTEPVWSPLLKACGWGVTSSGAAAVGTVTADPGNPTGATVAVPVISGTYGGAKNGILTLEIMQVDTDDLIIVIATFVPSDGTAAAAGSFTQDSTSAVSITTVASGLSFDFGDPDASTTGMVVGARYHVPLSAASVNTYKPISTSIPCLDVAIYQDGLRHTLHSCRGTGKISCANAGAPVYIDWDFMGIPSGIPTDQSLLSGIAYDDTVAPSFKGVTATTFSATPQCFNAFEIDLGAEVGLRECATTASGHYAARIVNRRMTGKINPVAALVATVDPWTGYFAGTTGNLSLAWGATAGNIITIAASKIQRLSLEDGDRDGEVENAIDFLLAEPDYHASDYSECSITLT